MEKDGKFDAKFRVTGKMRLVLNDEEPLHDGHTIWCGPDVTVYEIQPAVYYVDGLNLDEKGHLQDKFFWSDDPNASRIPSFSVLDLLALQEQGWVTRLEGSFESNDPDKISRGTS